ncbi:MAG: hypothetical protein Q6359_11400, partial [Candidatus Brocadiales bacterium]|nr:hypothetical protein [Candidatus Brocadiales bacterium]
ALGTDRRSKDLRHPLYVSVSDAERNFVVAELALQTKNRLVQRPDATKGCIIIVASDLRIGRHKRNRR